MSTIEILEKFKPYFTIQYFFMDIIVWLSYAIIQFFKTIVDAAEALLDAVYSINGFIFSEEVISYIKTYQPILWVLFAFALVVLGYTLIIENEKRPKVFQNIVVAVLVLTALPVIVQQVSSFTFSAAQFARTDQTLASSYDGGASNIKTSDAIIIGNTTDLVWCHNTGWENLQTDDNPNGIKKPWNNLTSIDQLDPMEKLWAHKGGEEYADVEEFANHLTYDDNGNASLSDIEDSWFGAIFIQVYYRYHVDWLPTVLTLLFTGLALVFAAYKVARLIWELAVHQFLAQLFAASDLTSGQKIKEVLKSMGSIFLTIYLVSVILKFFLMGVQYVQSTSLNGLVKAFIIVFFALAAIDGPNIIERILGVDAGIRSGFHTAFAAMRGIGAAKRTVSGAAHAVGNAAKTAGRSVKSAVRSGGSRVDSVAGHTGVEKGVSEQANARSSPTVGGIHSEGKNATSKQDVAAGEKQSPAAASVQTTAASANQEQKATDGNNSVIHGEIPAQMTDQQTPTSGEQTTNLPTAQNGGIYTQGFQPSEQNPAITPGSVDLREVPPPATMGASTHKPVIAPSAMGTTEKQPGIYGGEKGLPQQLPSTPQDSPAATLPVPPENNPGLYPSQSAMPDTAQQMMNAEPLGVPETTATSNNGGIYPTVEPMSSAAQVPSITLSDSSTSTASISPAPAVSSTPAIPAGTSTAGAATQSSAAPAPMQHKTTVQAQPPASILDQPLPTAPQQQNAQATPPIQSTEKPQLTPSARGAKNPQITPTVLDAEKQRGTSKLPPKKGKE